MQTGSIDEPIEPTVAEPGIL